MGMFDLFGGSSIDLGSPAPLDMSGTGLVGDNSSYFTLPDFTQPANYVSLNGIGPSYTAPDTGGFFSSVGSLFSSAGNGIASTTSSAWSSVANLFGGSTAPNASANTSATIGGGVGVLSTVASIFTGVEKAVGTAFSNAGSNIKSGATKTASFGGNLLGKFVGGIVSGAGLPTILVIVAIVGVIAYIWMRRA